MSFRKDFVWGAATAAHQVEGAGKEGGKGADIWDMYSEMQGNIYLNQNALVTCDQYHLYKDDVKLMKEMGLMAYRFSINWSRVLPEGVGEPNAEGIAYYNRLIDALVENGIEPYITLYHWDLPVALHRRGGWQNPEIVGWFADYARLVAENFSDRVKYFFTLNEPECSIGLGYRQVHAPGVFVSDREFMHVIHNVLKAHGAAVKALRKYAKQEIKIGIVPTGAFFYPETERPEDIEAARRAMFKCEDSVDGMIWNIAVLCDPIFFGEYPRDMKDKFGHFMPEMTEDDKELIMQPLDFFAFNIYNGIMVRADESGEPQKVDRYPGFPRTAIGWPVTPECMRWAARFLYERYGKTLYIAENGMSSHDWVMLDGKVHDAERVDFMHRYLLELRKAAEDGVDIAGYFAWSLLDNFEWREGYRERFGMIYVDYRTQERTIKDSGYWYRDVILANGENL